MTYVLETQHIYIGDHRVLRCHAPESDPRNNGQGHVWWPRRPPSEARTPTSTTIWRPATRALPHQSSKPRGPLPAPTKRSRELQPRRRGTTRRGDRSSLLFGGNRNSRPEPLFPRRPRSSVDSSVPSTLHVERHNSAGLGAATGHAGER